MARLAFGSSIGPFPYRLQEQVGEGEGGMSHLYRAVVGKPEDKGDSVVIKIVNIENNPDFHRETLDNEVETLRRLASPGHPGVVSLYPVVGAHVRAGSVYTAQTTLPGKPWFFVMEYLAGGSVADLVKRRRRLEVGLALHITLAVLEILEYTHQQGFVHLDLKPENLMFRKSLNEGIEVVLVDFGIARGPGQLGLEAGTVNWSPPERIWSTIRKQTPPENAPRPHPSMDVYAVGLLLYYMVTGRMPFTGRSRARVTSAILEGNPTSASRYEPTVSPELDRLIAKALARNPPNRPTVREFMASLRALQGKYPFEFREGTLGSKGARIYKRRRVTIPWAVVALLAIVAVMALLLFMPGLGANSAGALTPSGTATAAPAPTEQASEVARSPTARATATARATPPATRTRAAPTQSATPAPTSTRVTPPTPEAGTPESGGDN